MDLLLELIHLLDGSQGKKKRAIEDVIYGGILDIKKKEGYYQEKYKRRGFPEIFYPK